MQNPSGNHLCRKGWSRKLISFRELATVVNKYHNYPGVPEGERIYIRYLAKRDVWDNLHSLSESRVREVVVAFPNRWKTRIPYDCVPELTKLLKGLDNNLSFLRTETLLKVDLQKKVRSDGQIWTLSEVFMNCFDSISKVGARNRKFGFTGTTKVLHMIVPEFFVMCDDRIAAGYGYAQNSMGYRKFFEEMQRFGRTVVESYQSEFKADETEAVREVLRLCNDEGKTLTKTIDEFNYATYTLNIH